MMLKNETNIVLIGPMGVGKTSVGRRLACVLKRDFFDSDFEIINRTGVSIDHIFEIEGEAGFRERETKMLQDLCDIPNIVIATGGGIVLRAENRALLNNAFVVYLSASIEQLLKHTTKSKSRPLLEQSNDREKTIRELVATRDPLYKSVANAVIDTTGKKLYAIISDIKKSLKL